MCWKNTWPNSRINLPGGVEWASAVRLKVAIKEKHMARYVDGFVLPVPKKTLARYRRVARVAAKVWREHGALEYVECVADQLTSKQDGKTFTRRRADRGSVGSARGVGA
jgi:hypothetical protein